MPQRCTITSDRLPPGALPGVPQFLEDSALYLDLYDPLTAQIVVPDVQTGTTGLPLETQQ